MHSQTQCYRGLAAAQGGTVWTIREGGTGGGSHCHLCGCRQRRCCRCSLPEVGGCVISGLSVVQQTLQLQPATWLPRGVGHLVGAWSAPCTDTFPALFEGSSCQDAVTNTRQSIPYVSTQCTLNIYCIQVPTPPTKRQDGFSKTR